MALSLPDATRIFGIGFLHLKDTARARVGHPGHDSTIAVETGILEVFLNTDDLGVGTDPAMRGVRVEPTGFIRFAGVAVVLADGNSDFYLQTHRDSRCCAATERT